VGVAIETFRAPADGGTSIPIRSGFCRSSAWQRGSARRHQPRTCRPASARVRPARAGRQLVPILKCRPSTGHVFGADLVEHSPRRAWLRTRLVAAIDLRKPKSHPVLTNNNLDVRPVDFWVCFTQVGDFITIADELLRSHAATQFGSVGPLEFHSVKTIARPRGGRTCKTNSFNTPSAGFIANPLRKESSPDHPTRNVHLRTYQNATRLGPPSEPNRALVVAKKVACLRMGRQGGGSDPANAPSVSPRQQMDVQRAVGRYMPHVRYFKAKARRKR
jgi:hypothetical protein